MKSVSLSENFFFKGYSTLALRESPVREKFLNSIKSAKDGAFDKEKFSWKTKYHGTEDFRESIFDYDSSFIDILFDNNIPQLIEKCLNCRRVTLAHIQLRKSYPGNSYMDWHRDNYLKNGEKSGTFPPSVKIIYYPLYKEAEDCLKVIPGSHIRFFEDGNQDLEINSKFPYGVVRSSDSSMTLFDTSIYHGAVSGTDENGSLRLIYSFVNREQYLENFSPKEIHQRVNNYYERNL